MSAGVSIRFKDWTRKTTAERKKFTNNFKTESLSTKTGIKKMKSHIRIWNMMTAAWWTNNSNIEIDWLIENYRY